MATDWILQWCWWHRMGVGDQWSLTNGYRPWYWHKRFWWQKWRQLRLKLSIMNYCRKKWCRTRNSLVNGKVAEIEKWRFLSIARKMHIICCIYGYMIYHHIIWFIYNCIYPVALRYPDLTEIVCTMPRVFWWHWHQQDTFGIICTGNTETRSSPLWHAINVWSLFLTIWHRSFLSLKFDLSRWDFRAAVPWWHCHQTPPFKYRCYI